MCCTCFVALNVVCRGKKDFELSKRQKFWPITMVTYLYINPDQTSSDSEWFGFWKFFVDYITTSAEGQDLATHSEFGFTKLPPSVIEKSKEQIAKYVKGPDGAAVWIQERADTTQKFVGAGDYVISGKRKSNAFAKRTALAAALGKQFGTKDTVVESGLIKELENLEAKVAAIPVSKLKTQVMVSRLRSFDCFAGITSFILCSFTNIY